MYESESVKLLAPEAVETETAATSVHAERKGERTRRATMKWDQEKDTDAAKVGLNEACVLSQRSWL